MKRIICLSTVFLFFVSFAIADERAFSDGSLLSSLMSLFFPSSQADIESIQTDEDMALKKDEGEAKGDDYADITIFRRGHRIKPEIVPAKARKLTK
jgi:hypothetical protein